MRPIFQGCSQAKRRFCLIMRPFFQDALRRNADFRLSGRPGGPYHWGGGALLLGVMHGCMYVCCMNVSVRCMFVCTACDMRMYEGMYVYLYAYVCSKCAHTHACTHPCTHACTPARTHTHMHAPAHRHAYANDTYMHVHVRMCRDICFAQCACTCTCSYTCTCAFACLAHVHSQMRMRMRMHIDMHRHIHTHAHTHTPSQVRTCVRGPAPMSYVTSSRNKPITKQLVAQQPAFRDPGSRLPGPPPGVGPGTRSPGPRGRSRASPDPGTRNPGLYPAPGPGTRDPAPRCREHVPLAPTAGTLNAGHGSGTREAKLGSRAPRTRDTGLSASPRGAARKRRGTCLLCRVAGFVSTRHLPFASLVNGHGSDHEPSRHAVRAFL
jgi:hypothetical protein